MESCHQNDAISWLKRAVHIWYRMTRCERTVGREPSWRRLNSEYHKVLAPLQVNNVRMVVSPLWRGPANIQGFVLGGKSYQLGLATTQTPN